MSQFLVVYHRASGKLVEEVVEFDERADALKARTAAEIRHLNADNPIEIVLLGAKDRADLEKTHRRYFHHLNDLAAVGKR